jgi:hypothetical protein
MFLLATLTVLLILIVRSFVKTSTKRKLASKWPGAQWLPIVGTMYLYMNKKPEGDEIDLFCEIYVDFLNVITTFRPDQVHLGNTSEIWTDLLPMGWRSTRLFHNESQRCRTDFELAKAH